jgi:glycosyltransferase involved in cell wall biosynthesis
VISNQLIVSFSTNRWYGKWSEKQSILGEFARHGNTAVQVEHPFHVREVLKGQTGDAPAGLHRIDEGLYHIAPSRLHPTFYGQHAANRALQAMRIRSIRKQLNRIAPGVRPILYLWHPDFLHAVGQFNERCVVYHKFDRYPIVGEPTPDLLRRERALIEAADVSLAVSQEIIDSDPMFSDLQWMPNGAEFERFREVVDAAKPLPEDLAAIPGPRVGYVGAINQKLDYGLLDRLADSMPACSFVLIGNEQIESAEDRAAVNKLKARNNVHFLGLKSFEVYPQYVAGLDAGLILNTADKAEWVRYCYPLKLHEYLSCGLPVVSTDIPSVREFSEVVTIATNDEQWRDAVTAAIGDQDPAKVARRVEVGRANSWGQRVAKISALIERSLV